MTKTINTNILGILILTGTFLFISCSGNKGIRIGNKEIGQAYNESLDTWTQQKKKHNNSYEFAFSHSSWVGYRNTTTVVVKQGKIISRTFSENQLDENDYFTQEEVLVYEEKESEINTHEQGFKAQTIDQVYEDCGTKSLKVSEGQNNLFFKADGNGIIQSCGYSMKNCADDCFNGVTIQNFRWLE